MLINVRIRYDQRGFTLIELLVVIAIIGILTSILLPNYISVRQRARDVQRKSDLRQIQTALEVYRADNGSYKTDTSTYRLNSTTCTTSSSFTNTAGTVTYLQKIPCDPLGTSALYNTGNYYYYSNGVTYTLATCLENTNDSEGTTTAPTPNASGTCTTYFKLTPP